MLFGRKKEEAGKTVLIVDVEGGSVGAAVAKVSADGNLEIVSEARAHVPVRPHRSAERLAADIERLAGELAARMSGEAHPLGGISQTSVFLAPPWGRPNLASGTPDFVPHMRDSLERHLSPYFPKPQFYTNAGAAALGLRAVVPQEDKYLLCIVTHETTELLLVHNGAVVGHASMPHGINLPLRTLRTHGGLSEPEARSALKLGHLAEPLKAATEAYSGEFFAAGKQLFDLHAPTRVWVVSPMGDYFAKALSHESLGGLFPQGGTVSALRPQHLRALLPGAGSQDIFLLLEALFVLYS